VYHTVRPGDTHALLGENGSGKSTLIKILSGFHRPESGQAVIDGAVLSFGRPADSYKLGARFVHQDLGLIDSVSIADNLALGTGFRTRFATVRPWASRGSARADLARVGLDLDPRLEVGSLSAADKTGVAIARALRPDGDTPARLLVLDEPTATLPTAEVERLMTILRRVAANGVGVVYVSHRLDEVFRLCTTVTVLRDGALVRTLPVSALTTRSLIDLLVGDELAEAHEVAETLVREPLGAALTLRNLTGPSLADVSVGFEAGQVTGIAGITGSGRDALLGAVFGATSRRGDVITKAGKHIRARRPRQSMRQAIAYVPADRKVNGGVMQLSARENLALTDLRPFRRLATMRRRPERAEAQHWFDELDVRPRGDINLPLEAFSGGNQQKIVFGKWLRRRPEVFLLDEPTQGVDVGAKAMLHQQLVRVAAGGAAVVVSSSEMEELVAICQRVIVFRNGRIAADLAGADISVRSLNAACLDHEES
jgi:ribose transport system ATP-binding protein